MALDAGTLVPLVCKLVAQSLLLRERSPEDERSVIISLTDAGQALQQQAHAVYAQAACATQCTLEQRQALTAQLQALRAALNHSLRGIWRAPRSVPKGLSPRNPQAPKEFS